jgi:hypothetical protein
MSNSKKKNVTIQNVMGTADFLHGIRDAQQGKPVKDQWDARTQKGVANEQWSYERGRLFWFWIVSQGKTDMQIKQGRTVTYEAQREFSEAYRCKAIL